MARNTHCEAHARSAFDQEELATPLALLGAITLREFGRASDPVRQTLVPVAGFLA